MQDTSKYLIHADITADGVVERSDVVGAIFGQTEGLLGDDLDLRDLQDASKVGRIDVEIDSENGQSFGEVTIASGLDKVETAILAAALETIDRIGPCRAKLVVSDVEDVRTAKRREVVERAKTLLTDAFDGDVMTSEDIVEEVRQSVRVEDITEYEGYPAGPRVADSDAIIVVEGRADVLTLLQYGVKNAVAVEGTNVPEEVAALTEDRTVTAFLDGDRGGELILKELSQVGDIDYVALAPPNRSVEDLNRHEVMAALREKVPYEAVAGADGPQQVAATDGSTQPAPVTDAASVDAEAPAEPDAPGAGQEDAAVEETAEDAATDEAEAEPETEPSTLREHVRAVVERGTGTVRLLGPEYGVLAEGPVDEAFDLVRDAEQVPAAVVLDGTLTQRVLDVAAQRGVDQLVAREEGEFVKKPASVRTRTADRLLAVPDQE
ncbi:MAG: DNA primase DnaG [Haloarculaceae archaeon]